MNTDNTKLKRLITSYIATNSGEDRSKVADIMTSAETMSEKEFAEFTEFASGINAGIDAIIAAMNAVRAESFKRTTC